MCSLIKSISFSVFQFTFPTSLLGLWKIEKAIKRQDTGSSHMLEVHLTSEPLGQLSSSCKNTKKKKRRRRRSDSEPQQQQWNETAHEGTVFTVQPARDWGWGRGPRTTSFQTSQINIQDDVSLSPLNLIFARKQRTQKSGVPTVTVLL